MRSTLCLAVILMLPFALYGASWEQWFARAQAHLDSGRYEQTAAIAAYVLRRADRQPVRETAWYLLAAAFFHAGMPRAAARIAYTHTGEQILPMVGDQAAQFLGRLFWHCLENQQQALYIARLSRQLCDSCFEAYFRLGYCYTYLLPDPEKARFYFSEGLRRFPANNERSRRFLSDQGH